MGKLQVFMSKTYTPPQKALALFVFLALLYKHQSDFPLLLPKLRDMSLGSTGSLYLYCKWQIKSKINLNCREGKRKFAFTRGLYLDLQSYGHQGVRINMGSVLLPLWKDIISVRRSISTHSFNAGQANRYNQAELTWSTTHPVSQCYPVCVKYNIQYQRLKQSFPLETHKFEDMT